MSIAIWILLFVTVERLAELWFARRNTRRLIAAGAREHGATHYPFLVAVHVTWLATLWVLAPGRDIDRFWLAMFALLLIARFWVIATLGSRWTTRIIVRPDTPLVRSGPYRWFNHPNYLVVIGEIAVLPLVFGLWVVALVFSLINGAILWIRIREENRALANGRHAP